MSSLSARAIAAMAARVDGATVDPDLVFDVGEGAGVSVDLAHLDVDGRLRRNIDPVGEGSGWLGWLRSRGEGLEFLDPAYRWLVIGSAQAIDPYGDGLDGRERRLTPIGVPAHLSDGHRRIRRPTTVKPLRGYVSRVKSCTSPIRAGSAN